MKGKRYIYIVLTVLLVVLFALDTCCGSIWISPFSIGTDWSPVERQIFLSLRLPKALTALLAGAALSVAGLIMQTLFRNPLAGPYILGVSSGASIGVAFLTMCSTMLAGMASVGTLGIAVSAIIGSTIVLLMVMVVAKRVKSSVSLLIVGIMIGSIAGALVNLMQNYANPDSLKLFIVWTLGSLGGVGWSQLPVMAGIVIAGLTVSLLLMKPLNGLLLGEDYARGLGVNISRTRWMIVAATGLLAGGVTAFCGPIAFVGVAVPHIARMWLGSTNHRLTLPASALIGGNLLLICDTLCNIGTYPLPISTMSALFGAPIIIWIILRK